MFRTMFRRYFDPIPGVGADPREARPEGHDVPLPYVLRDRRGRNIVGTRRSTTEEPAPKYEED